jgi:hypothetical protein
LQPVNRRDVKVKNEKIYIYAQGAHPRVCQSLYATFQLSNFHSGGYEEFYLLEYNAMYSVESQLTFQRNMYPPGSNWFLSWLIFDPEDGSDMFLRNVG